MRVLGTGPPNPQIVIVGEAPGQEEDAIGRPFVGSSGRLLTDMLIRCGINRSLCYITNVAKQRPPSNNFGFYYSDKKRTQPTLQLLSLWTELRAELSLKKPNIVIALGGEALRALVDKTRITKWRGSVVELDLNGWKCKLISTFHPAAILRLYKNRTICELDLKRAKEESLDTTIVTPKVEFFIKPSFVQVISYLTLSHKRLAFDIETSGKHVRCLGFSSGVRKAFCIPFIANQRPKPSKTMLLAPSGSSGSYWTEVEERAILRELERLFKDENVEKIAQNFPFDSSVLMEDLGLDVRGLWMDTMIAQHECYCELPKSLDFLTSIYTKQPRYSDYEVSSDESTWIYNCYDASITFEVALRLENEMTELGVLKHYREIAQPAMISLARAGNRGVLVDIALRDVYMKDYELKLEKVKDKLLVLIGKPLNPNSPKQMKEYLYTTLNLPPQHHYRTKLVTCDEEAIDKLRLKYPQHEDFFDLVIDYREAVTLMSLLRAELTLDNRCQTSYNATGTVTGRISSSETIWKTGANLQQQPRGKFRRIYIAPLGMLFVKADLSQAEARVVAHLSKNEELIKLFEDPKFDVHMWNTSLILEKPQDQISKAERHNGKQSLHSANYKGGPRTAVKHAKIPYAQAKHALEKYQQSSPDLLKWWDKVEEQLLATRKFMTPLGRLRIFLDRINQTTLRSAIAFVPQSTIGDQINRAFSRIDFRLPKGCRLILQIHDEVVCESPPALVLKCASIIKEELEHPIVINGRELIVPSEVSVGKNWFDLELLSVWKEKNCV